MLAKCRDLHTFSLTNLGEMLRFTRFDACWQNVAIHALCQAQNFGCQALSTILHPCSGDPRSVKNGHFCPKYAIFGSKMAILRCFWHPPVALSRGLT